MARQKKITKKQVNGGQWIFDAVFELEDGTVIEGTRFTAKYAESQVKGDSPQNIGYLLKGRTREALQKVGLL